VEVTGIDPIRALLDAAQARYPEGTYLEAAAERLPFDDDAFDLVVSYLSLIDIPSVQEGISEMARVLKPGGALLIANLTSFNTACADAGWVKNSDGQHLYYPVDNYLQERPVWVEFRGIRVINHHRPMSIYMSALLGAGLRLTYFDEPTPSADAPTSEASEYIRAPWFLVMEWVKPAQGERS